MSAQVCPRAFPDRIGPIRSGKKARQFKFWSASSSPKSNNFGGKRSDCPLKLLDRKPERLVVTGLRCCMAGYNFGDIDCWETAWRSYCMELGTSDARRLMGELQYWVRCLRAESMRPLDVFPHGCGHVCRDECMALSVIAALQDNDLSTALLAARHLSGNIEGEAPLSLTVSGQGYADALVAAGQKLMSVPASVVLSIAGFWQRALAGAGDSPLSQPCIKQSEGDLPS